MSNIVAVAITALCLTAGGYGLYQIAFAQGYVEGYEEASHPSTIMFEDE